MRGFLSMILLPCAAGTAAAQVTATADAGLGEAGYFSMAPRLRAQQGPVRIELTGERNDYGHQGAGLAGFGAGSFYQRLGGPLQLELLGEIQAQHRLGRTDAAAALGGGRIHLIGHRSGLWLGAGAGSNHLGGIHRWETGAWHSMGPLALQVQVWRTSSRFGTSRAEPGTGFPDTLAPPAPEEVLTEVRSTTDLGLWSHWARGRAEMRFGGGMRFGRRKLDAGERETPGQVSSTWWSAEATYWMMERLGLVTTVGRSPIDPALGSSGEQFLRVGFRASLHPRSVTQSQGQPVERASSRFRTRLHPNREVEITVIAAAGLVEVMGDFTGWEPQAMAREGDRWELRLVIPPGLHRINIRYDGGPWQAPPGTRILLDEFGQESGELVL